MSNKVHVVLKWMKDLEYSETEFQGVHCVTTSLEKAESLEARDWQYIGCERYVKYTFVTRFVEDD